MNRRHVCFFLIPLACSRFGVAQATDSFAGTWLLSRGKSDFDPPQNFFKRTIVIETIDHGYHVITRTVTDRQQTVESTYSSNLDGKDAPVENSPLDTMALKRIDGTTLEGIGKIKTKVIETNTFKISVDGKVLTIETKGNLNGDEYTSTQVFNRQ